MPLSRAIRRASGEAKIRPLAGPEGAGVAVSIERIVVDRRGICRGQGPGCAAGCGAAAVSGAAAGAEGAAAATSPISAALSPSSSKTAMTALTFTPSVPSGTTSLPTVPSSTASTSMVALSVSISAMMSPDETVSPSLTSHLASVPSSMVGERAGIRMLTGIARSLSDSRRR